MDDYGEMHSNRIRQVAVTRVAVWSFVLGFFNGLHWVADILSWGMLVEFSELFRWVALWIGGFISAWLARAYLATQARSLYAAFRIGFLYVLVWEMTNFLVGILGVFFPGAMAYLLLPLFGKSPFTEANNFSYSGLALIPSIEYSCIITPALYFVGLFGAFSYVILDSFIHVSQKEL